jgi:hypothetical protein
MSTEETERPGDDGAPLKAEETSRRHGLWNLIEAFGLRRHLPFQRCAWGGARLERVQVFSLGGCSTNRR